MLNKWIAKKKRHWKELSNDWSEFKSEVSEHRKANKAEYERKEAERNPGLFKRVFVAAIVIGSVPTAIALLFSGVFSLFGVVLLLLCVWLWRSYVTKKPSVKESEASEGNVTKSY